MGTATKAPAQVNTTAAASALGNSKTPTAWAKGVLAGIGAPINPTTVGNLGTWLGNEQNANTFAANAGNPLGVQTPTALAAGKSGNVLGGVNATAGTLLAGYPTIVAALRTSAPSSVFNRAVVNSPWNNGKSNGTGYGGLASFSSRGSLASNPTGWFGQWAEPVLTGSAVGLKNNPIVPITNTVIAPIKAVTSTGGLISKITNPTNLKNVGIFVAGLALAVTGLVIFMSSTKEGKQAATAAVEVG